MLGLWIGFIALILAALALDLGVFNRKAHAITIRQSLGWVCFWISLALTFNVAVYFMYESHWHGLGLAPGHALDGKEAALRFFTAYVVEYSLSVDNLFVFAIIFMYFGIPPKYQHRALFWGIVGAIVLRGAMIGAGTALIQRFDWVIYAFGLMLLLTAVKLLFSKEENYDPEKNIVIKLTRRFLPVTKELQGERFVTRMNDKLVFTPLFIVLLAIDVADVVFAIDSIPAAIAVCDMKQTTGAQGVLHAAVYDSFLVFTSNIFAILGLRMLYFALAAMLGLFHYLKISLVFVLGFVGVKMLLTHFYKIKAEHSLLVIVGILLLGVIASIIKTRRDNRFPVRLDQVVAEEGVPSSDK